MNNRSPISDRLRELVDAVCDQTITPPQVEELEHLIAGDETALEFYIQAMWLDEGIARLSSPARSIIDAGHFDSVALGESVGESTLSSSEKNDMVVAAQSQSARSASNSGSRIENTPFQTTNSMPVMLNWLAGIAACFVLAISGLVLWQSGIIGSGGVAKNGTGGEIEIVAKDIEATMLKEELVNPVRFGVESVQKDKLVDGTIVISKPGTVYSVEGKRQVRLSKGELYLIVAKSDSPFVVKTPEGRALATGTRFNISVGGDTKTAVAQGRITLESKSGAIELGPGQQGVLSGTGKPIRRPAKRISHLVNWAKEALKQPRRLVEKTNQENGLIAVDPNGQKGRLSLRQYNVDVYIENGVARTTIDQTFFNHYPWNTEGTFYFPLPPDASVSRLAMYVFGELNEGGMVTRERGQQIYTDILHQRRDPALLEMMEGNMFKMRIFPLEGRHEKRIFLSYTQNLEELYGSAKYWFPMDHTSDEAGKLTLKVHIKDGATKFSPQSSTHEMQVTTEGDDLVLKYSADKVKPDQDFLLSLLPKIERGIEPDKVGVAVCEREGVKYIQANFSPNLGRAMHKPQPRQWVVLNDVSASRSRIDVRAQHHILKRLVAEADDDDSVFVIDLNTMARALAKSPLNVRDKSLDRLFGRETLRLIGATNVQAGFEAVKKAIRQHKMPNPHVVYLGDGVATDGTSSSDELIEMLPGKCKFVGVGVGKKVDALFLKQAADRTGGTFATINPNEDIDWRVFDLLASMNTSRMTRVKAELLDASGRSIDAIAYPNSNVIAAGETLTVTAMCKKQYPSKIRFTGRVNGRPFSKTVDVAKAKENGDFIPRLWAKRHIDELLKSNMDAKQEIISLSRDFYVVTPFTSLIVLEDDAMYQEYKVERGRRDHWAKYDAPKTIEVVNEPLASNQWGYWGWDFQSEDSQTKVTTNPKTVKEIVDNIQVRLNAPFYVSSPSTGDSRNGLNRLAELPKPDGPSLSRYVTLWFLLASGEKDSVNQWINPMTGTSAQRKKKQPRVFEIEKALSPNRFRSQLFPSTSMQGLRRLRGHSLLSDLHFAEVDAEVNAWFEDFGEADDMYMPMQSVEWEDTDGVRDSVWLDVGLPGLAGPMSGPGLDISGRFGGMGMGMGMGGMGMGGGGFGGWNRMAQTISVPNSGKNWKGIRPYSRIQNEFGPKLAQSFRLAMESRRSRIHRDVQQQNEQYGYDTTRQAGQRRFSRFDFFQRSVDQLVRVSDLDELVPFRDSISRAKPQLRAASALPFFDPEDVSLEVGNEELFALLPMNLPDSNQSGQVVPRDFFSVARQPISTQPGMVSVLAADLLSQRLVELEKSESSNGIDKKVSAEKKAIKLALSRVAQVGGVLEPMEKFWGYSTWSYVPGNQLSWQMPRIQAHPQYPWSYDLTRYTRGLYSSQIDMAQEVVDHYGALKTKGQIDEQSKSLIKLARSEFEPIAISFGDSELLVGPNDQFSKTNTSEMYLTEKLVCDGKHLMHVYDELGIVARRDATSLHLSRLRSLVPHLISDVESLVRDMDVQLVSKDTDTFTVKLTFAKVAEKEEDETTKTDDYLLVKVDYKGRVLQRKFVRGDETHGTAETQTPETQLTLDFDYSEKGKITLKWTGADGKEIGRASFKVRSITPDDKTFSVDVEPMVVFDMPIKKPQFYLEKLESLVPGVSFDENVDAQTKLRKLREKTTKENVVEAVRLRKHLALAYQQDYKYRRWPQQNPANRENLEQALELMRKHDLMASKGDVALFGSCTGGMTNTRDSFGEFEDSPLYNFFRWRGQKGMLWKSIEKARGLVGHLGTFNASAYTSEKERFDHFSKTYPNSPLALALTTFRQNGAMVDDFIKLHKQPRWRGIALMVAMNYAGTPEDQKKVANAIFEWDDSLEDKQLLPILTKNVIEYCKARDEKRCHKMMTRQFKKLNEGASSALMMHLGEVIGPYCNDELKQKVYARIRELLKIEEMDDQTPMIKRFAYAQSLWASGQVKLAWEQYGEIIRLLDEKGIGSSPGFIAAAARLALQAGDREKAIELEEQALKLEIPYLPDAIDLNAFRQRYQWLWSQYEAQAKTAKSISEKREQLISRATATWDRWRMVDRDNPGLHQQMASLMKTLGHNDDAWTYLSSMIDEKPKDAQTYTMVGAWYQGQRDQENAIRWMKQAPQWDTANPRWIFQYGQMLKAFGKKKEANVQFKKVINGTWAPGLQNWVSQAQGQLE